MDDRLVLIFLMPLWAGLYVMFWMGFWMILTTPFIRFTGKQLPELSPSWRKIALVVLYDPSSFNDATCGTLGKYLGDLTAFILGFIFTIYVTNYLVVEFF